MCFLNAFLPCFVFAIIFFSSHQNWNYLWRTCSARVVFFTFTRCSTNFAEILCCHTIHSNLNRKLHSHSIRIFATKATTNCMCKENSMNIEYYVKSSLCFACIQTIANTSYMQRKPTIFHIWEECTSKRERDCGKFNKMHDVLEFIIDLLLKNVHFLPPL